MKKRLFCLSIDAMVSEDLEFIKTLPYLGPVVEKGAVCRDILTVYPSLTYTCHASMLTGVYPDRHHVVNNEVFQPGVEHTPWYFNASVMDKEVENVVSLAKRNGYTTCCVSWPVTGGIECDHLIPETWCEGQSREGMYEKFLAEGADKMLLDQVWARWGRKLEGLGSNPHFHLFMLGATLEALKLYAPEVTFLHLSMVDHTRHSDGVFGDRVYKSAYMEIDLMFGLLVEEMKKQGTYDETTFVITSDHGQTPVDHLSSPNVLFVRDGLMELNPDGTLKRWKACVQSGAHSAQVYLSDKNDEALKAQVRELLEKYRKEEDVGFGEILSVEETRERYHLDGDFSFVVEGSDTTSFTSRTTGPVSIHAWDNENYKYSQATHGHMPEKGPKPCFVLSGPGVRGGVEISGRPIVDEAPTIARLLGFDMQAADGVPMTELLDA